MRALLELGGLRLLFVLIRYEWATDSLTLWQCMFTKGHKRWGWRISALDGYLGSAYLGISFYRGERVSDWRLAAPFRKIK